MPAAARARRQLFVDNGVGAAQVAARGQLGDGHCGIVDRACGNIGKALAEMIGGLAVEILRQARVQRLVHRDHRLGRGAARLRDILAQPPRQEAQAADAEAQVLGAEEQDRLVARPAALAREPVHAAAVQLGADRSRRRSA